MRILALVVAGALVGLWFAVRTLPDPTPATPPGGPRAAHLGSLAAQIARARSVRTSAGAELARPTPALAAEVCVVELSQITSTIALDASLLALPRGQRLAALEAALGHPLAVEDQLLLGLEDEADDDGDSEVPTLGCRVFEAGTPTK